MVLLCVYMCVCVPVSVPQHLLTYDRRLLQLCSFEFHIISNIIIIIIIIGAPRILKMEAILAPFDVRAKLLCGCGSAISNVRVATRCVSRNFEKCSEIFRGYIHCSCVICIQV